MPRRYSKIERHMWRDPRVRKLDRDTREMFRYLLSAPDSTRLPGLVPVHLATVVNDLQWEPFQDGFERVNSSLNSLETVEWVQYDKQASLFYIPRAIYHNLPDNPNVIKGWANDWDEIPVSLLKNLWIRNTENALKKLSEEGKLTTKKLTIFRTVFKRFLNGSETVSEQSRKQEQEQDNNIYIYKKGKKQLGNGSRRVVKVDDTQEVDDYNLALGALEGKSKDAAALIHQNWPQYDLMHLAGTLTKIAPYISQVDYKQVIKNAGENWPDDRPLYVHGNNKLHSYLMSWFRNTATQNAEKGTTNEVRQIKYHKTRTPQKNKPIPKDAKNKLDSIWGK